MVQSNHKFVISISPPLPLLIDMDGNVYTTVTIGTQEWMVENLRTITYADSSPISNITNNVSWTTDTIGAYCWYDNSIGYKDSYGALYNWKAISNAHGLISGQFKLGAVPSTGWRLPTAVDMSTLSTFIGGDTTGGGKLKTTSNAYWQFTGGTDDYGFNARGGGRREFDTGAFNALKIFGQWFQERIGLYDTIFYMNYSYNDLIRDSEINNGSGNSIRCLRDV